MPLCLASSQKFKATITGIFVDAANAYLIANGPSATDDQGNQVGPFPFGWLLDECPQLPKLDTVVNGPSVGRSKKVFYIIHLLPGYRVRVVPGTCDQRLQ